MTAVKTTKKPATKKPAAKKPAAKAAVKKSVVATAAAITPPKMALKPTVKVNISELKPRDPDTKYLGDEPDFTIQPEIEHRGCALGQAFNWYHRFYGRKEARECLSQYLEVRDRKAEAKSIRGVTDSETMTTFGWIARMSLRGLELTQAESDAIDSEVARMIATLDRAKVTEKDETTPATNRVNIQELMRERARAAGGEIDGLLDEYVLSGGKAKTSKTVMEILQEQNILPQHIGMLTPVWTSLIGELEQYAAGKDEQLLEAYGHLNKTQVKNLIKFCEQIVTDLNAYINVKRAQKAPRARKAVSPEKQASKLKYLKQFDQLKLTSVAPAKIIGATEVWVYDTARRKLTYFVADAHSKTLGIKGNTIIGFDATQSQVKTIRKPETQIKEFVPMGKPAQRKFFKELKTVAVTPTGRFNEAMVILRAF